MHLMETAPGAEVVVDGRRYLYFCGTGYLGLQGHAALIEAACRATRQYGLGTATSRSGFGNSPPVLEVEQEAARFWDCEAAFYFASGYLGNHVLVAPYASSGHLALLDEHAHYSVADAARLIGLQVVRFAHRDAQSLRDALRAHLRGRQAPLIMTDGVFAARGSLAPVTDYLEVLRDYDGAVLCLDDCHACGCLGTLGRGTYEHYGISAGIVNSVADSSTRLLASGTLSKAFGGYGGVVCGTRPFVEQVKFASHYFRGASAPPTPAAAASAAALRLVRQSPQLITQLQQNACLLKQRLRSLALEVDSSPVPIISLTLGDRPNMQRIQRSLAEDGILIAYMNEYAGLSREGALRIATFATHSAAMIERLVESLRRYL